MKITTASHGGNYNELAKQHGLTKEMVLDFSANINPLGVPASLKQMITTNLDKLVEYPEQITWRSVRELPRFINST